MNNQYQKTVTFGSFISSIYDACNQRKARGLVRLAVNSRLMQFRGSDLYSISNRLQPGRRMAITRRARHAIPIHFQNTLFA